MSLSTSSIRKRIALKKSRNEEIIKVDLGSPTSISMKNSFIIKNASFDSAVPVYKKRRTILSHLENVGHSLQSVNTFQDGSKCFIKGKRPAARDGHTGVIMDGKFLVFGGDRHHMPFNDFFLLDIETEVSKRRLD
jgi:hypothetical protein